MSGGYFGGEFEIDYLSEIDGYCERLTPAYWAEPVNALTNLAFVLVALVMWQRSAGLPRARGLAVILGLIGFGSFVMRLLDFCPDAFEVVDIFLVVEIITSFFRFHNVL